MKGYRKSVVWQKADELAFQIYTLTKSFPRNELFGITSQLRRAALSVPTNIVEGLGRRHRGETRQFINIALGSLAETEYLMEFCVRLKYLKDEEYLELDRLRNEVGAILWSLYQKF